MIHYGEKIEFTANLNRETTYSSENLGEGKCEMAIWVANEDQDKKPKEIESCDIEWLYFVDQPNEDIVGIGCWFEKGVLVDYDGVFSLPKEAIKLLRKNGFRVPRSFEE